MCYILGPREQDSLPGSSASVCPRLVRGCDRLMGTLQHYSASLHWEAGGWWTGDGVTLDGPWSLSPRVPSPSALRDLLLESMISSPLGCKPSILTQIPQISRLLHGLLDRNFYGIKKSLSENIVTPSSTERNLSDHQTQTPILKFFWSSWLKVKASYFLLKLLLPHNWITSLNAILLKFVLAPTELCESQSNRNKDKECLVIKHLHSCHTVCSPQNICVLLSLLERTKKFNIISILI